VFWIGYVVVVFDRFVHDAPSAAHRRHPNVYEIGVVPAQVPGDPTSVEPTEACPETLGATVTEVATVAGVGAVAGVAELTGPINADVAAADPTRLVTVTTARTNADASAFWST
jgi:hypothetical protein